MIITIVSYLQEWECTHSDSYSKFTIDNFYDLETAAEGFARITTKGYPDELCVLVDGFNVNDYVFTDEEYDSGFALKEVERIQDIINTIEKMAKIITKERKLAEKRKAKEVAKKKQEQSKKRKERADARKIEKEKTTLAKLKAKYENSVT